MAKNPAENLYGRYTAPFTLHGCANCLCLAQRANAVIIFMREDFDAAPGQRSGSPGSTVRPDQNSCQSSSSGRLAGAGAGLGGAAAGFAAGFAAAGATGGGLGGVEAAAGFAAGVAAGFAAGGAAAGAAGLGAGATGIAIALPPSLKKLTSSANCLP